MTEFPHGLPDLLARLEAKALQEIRFSNMRADGRKEVDEGLHDFVSKIKLRLGLSNAISYGDRCDWEHVCKWR